MKEFYQQVFEETKLTKKEFAEKVGVSIRTLDKWLNGKSEPLFINQKIMRSIFRNEVRVVDRRLR